MLIAGPCALGPGISRALGPGRSRALGPEAQPTPGGQEDPICIQRGSYLGEGKLHSPFLTHHKISPTPNSKVTNLTHHKISPAPNSKVTKTHQSSKFHPYKITKTHQSTKFHHTFKSYQIPLDTNQFQIYTTLMKNEHLLYLRTVLKWSVREIAKSVGVSHVSVVHWLSGKNVPTAAHEFRLRQLAQDFNIDQRCEKCTHVKTEFDL